MAVGTLSPNDIERQLAEKTAEMHGIQPEDLLKSLAARLSTIHEIASVTLARADTPSTNSATSISLTPSPDASRASLT